MKPQLYVILTTCSAYSLFLSSSFFKPWRSMWSILHRPLFSIDLYLGLLSPSLLLPFPYLLFVNVCAFVTHSIKKLLTYLDLFWFSYPSLSIRCPFQRLFGNMFIYSFCVLSLYLYQCRLHGQFIYR